MLYHPFSAEAGERSTNTKPQDGKRVSTNPEVWSIIEEKIEDVETNAVFHPFQFGNPYGYLYQDNATGSFTGLTSQEGRLEMLRDV